MLLFMLCALLAYHSSSSCHVDCIRYLVGEPLPTAAWKWYYKTVGKEKCVMVDTYWQTGN